MKAFPYIFNEGLVKGLRRFSLNPRNEQTLVECHNAMPCEEGLRPHEVVLSLDSDSVTWEEDIVYGYSENSLWVTGYNALYALGLGDTTDRCLFSETSGVWDSISGNGNNASLAIKSDGTLWGAGYGLYGCLNSGSIVTLIIFTQIGTDTDWAKVKGSNVGGLQVLAIKTDGSLWVTGYNSHGQLGLGDTTNRLSFVQVGSGTDWAEVGVGNCDSYAIKTDGTLWSTGWNNYGQLGQGDEVEVTSFTQVGVGTTWSKVAAGSSHTIVTKTDGTLWSTGLGGSGRLGLGDTSDRNTFEQAGVATDWDKIACGDSHSFAINTSKELWGTGLNGNGQLGMGATSSVDEFTQIGSGLWDEIASGRVHALGISSTGGLWSTGYNHKGQLGLGDQVQRTEFTRVGSISWAKISCGSYNSLALVGS